MVGRNQAPLIFCLPLAWAPSIAAGQTLHLEAGSPFVAASVHLPLGDAVSIGPRAVLQDAHALRLGPSLAVRWFKRGHTELKLHLELARTFGFRAVSTWDARLAQTLLFPLDEHETAVELELGLWGYQGPEPRHRGLLGEGSVKLWFDVGEGTRTGVELGWLTDGAHHRALAAWVLGWSPFMSPARVLEAASR